jgi:hypothetical protein
MVNGVYETKTIGPYHSPRTRGGGEADGVVFPCTTNHPTLRAPLAEWNWVAAKLPSILRKRLR